jgi:hypothetical protein
VLSTGLARALRDAGLVWRPEKGDRFVVPDRELDDEVFVISDMVVETLEVPEVGRLLAFNGTTEWALDSLAASEALWLPREGQLRELLGDALIGLERLSAEPVGYAVTVLVADGPRRHVDVDAESAYARALLELLRGGWDRGLHEEGSGT